jgi:hypothetical protein
MFVGMFLKLQQLVNHREIPKSVHMYHHELALLRLEDVRAQVPRKSRTRGFSLVVLLDV